MVSETEKLKRGKEYEEAAAFSSFCSFSGGLINQ
jgi:hypothetical protein